MLSVGIHAHPRFKVQCNTTHCTTIQTSTVPLSVQAQVPFPDPSMVSGMETRLVKHQPALVSFPDPSMVSGMGIRLVKCLPGLLECRAKAFPNVLLRDSLWWLRFENSIYCSHNFRSAYVIDTHSNQCKWELQGYSKFQLHPCSIQNRWSGFNELMSMYSCSVQEEHRTMCVSCRVKMTSPCLSCVQ